MPILGLGKEDEKAGKGQLLPTEKPNIRVLCYRGRQEFEGPKTTQKGRISYLHRSYQ